MPIRDIYIFEDSQQSISGGGQRVTAALLNELKEHPELNLHLFDTVSGHKSFFSNVIVTRRHFYRRPMLTPKGSDSAFTHSYLQSLLIGLCALLAGLRLTARLALPRRHRRAIFYCPTKFGFLIALLPSIIFRIRLVMHLHNIADPSISLSIFELFLRLGAKKVICVSEAVAKSIHHANKQVIRNPFPDRKAKRKPRAVNKLVIGVVASFFKYKGQELFLSVVTQFADHHKIEVRMFGDGPELPRLRQKFACDTIKFHGRVADLESIYSDLDIVVVPSLKSEAFSIVIPEAWAYGCVVVVSNVPAHLELVESGVNGEIFTAGDPHSLWAALETCIESELHRRNMVAGGFIALERQGAINYLQLLKEACLYA